jgi:hypothetical protein
MSFVRTLSRTSVAALIALTAARIAAAAENAPVEKSERPTDRAEPSTFVGLFAGTTLVQRPFHGGVAGPQGDLALSAGVGHFFTKSIALELDAGATLLRGQYAGTALVPAVVWVFHDVFYGAARFVVPVHPTLDLTVAPGLGAIYVFKNGLAPLVEINALGAVGAGRPSLGASATVGSLWLF